MTPKEFDELVEKTFDGCKTILISRETIYSSRGDRLGNFKRAASMTPNQTPSQALIGMWKKQIVSILDYVDRDLHLHLEALDEKITDAINYLVLLKALEVEKWKSGTSTTKGYVSELGQTQVATPDKSEPSLFEIGRLSPPDTMVLPEECHTVE